MARADHQETPCPEQAHRVVTFVDRRYDGSSRYHRLWVCSESDAGDCWCVDCSAEPINLGQVLTMEISVRSASRAEQDAVIGVVIAAFLTDPIARWMYPEAHQYFAVAGDFSRAFSGQAVAHGSAYCVEGYAGAALWLPPGTNPDQDALSALLTTTIPQHRHEQIFGLFEQMGNYHPEEPHWYLPQIAVDPMHQGRGYGSALMRHALLECDRQNKLAYLESSNPRNLSLYIRHGFELMGTIQLADSPPMFPMLRKPR
jgi:ribosomal protein S18 acetylase RimI-like enzyme